MRKLNDLALDQKKIKAIGMIVSIAGFGIQLMSNWVDTKTMEQMISEEVRKELDKVMKK